MNKPSINPDKSDLKEQPISEVDIAVLALKGTLLYGLDSFLRKKHEAANQSFTGRSSELAPTVKAETISSSKVFTGEDFIDWKTIPLQHKIVDNSLTYVSALPQMLRGSYDFSSAKSLRSQTQRLAKELNQFQLQIIGPSSAQLGTAFNFLSTLWNEFIVEAERPGWITFKLSNRGLWYWLEQFQINAHSTQPKHTLFISQLLLPNGQTVSSRQAASSLSGGCSTSHIPLLAWQLLYRKKFRSHSPSHLIANPNAIQLVSQLPVPQPPSAESQVSGSRVPNAQMTDSVTQLVWRAQYSFACCCSLIRQTETARQTTDMADSSSTDSSLTDSSSTDSSLTLKSCSTPITSIAIPSTLWTLIPEIVATIDAMGDERSSDERSSDERSISLQSQSNLDGVQPHLHTAQNVSHNAAHKTNPHKTNHRHTSPASLKQAARLCQAFDVFYRIDWARQHQLLSTDSAMNQASSQAVIQLLVAMRETLKILLRQYKAKASASL